MKNLPRNIRQNAVYYLAAILMALVLKQHYSQARAEDLVWILGPTAGLVSFISGDTFVFEAGTGYVCGVRRAIIAPACAGVNFMLMAFGMAVFSGMHHMRRRQHRLLWLIFSLLVSYFLTLGVNTLRIMVSVYTLDAGFFSSGSAWSRIHRLEGVVIYFFFQYLFYSMIQKVIKKYRANEPGRGTGPDAAYSGQRNGIRKTVIKGLMPCAWYLAVTLAVPFLNGAAGKYGSLFYNHAVMVTSLCLITWIGIIAVELCGQGVSLLLTGGFQQYEAHNPDC